MTRRHQELAAGRWFELSLVTQLANIGSEVERALKWAERGNEQLSRGALERGLELIDLTLSDPRHRHRLKEIARAREALLDHFWGENVYGSTAEDWRRYYYQFGVAAALERERQQGGSG